MPKHKQPKSTKIIILQILVPLFTLATLIVNFAASALPINNQTTGELSDKYFTIVTPAGFAFGIWGIIYTGLIAFSIYQAQPKYSDSKWFGNSRQWYLLSAVANMGWIVAWHYEQLILSLLFMLALLLSIIRMYIDLDIAHYRPSWPTKLFVHAPVSVYMGWISVATILNTTIVLQYVFGIESLLFPANIWSLMVQLVAAGLGIYALVKNRDYFYPVVILWGLIGIWVSNF